MKNREQKNEWEDWQLTAFALGELDGPVAERIAAAVQADPGLAVEVEQIRQTTGLVAAALEGDVPAGLSDESLAAILARAESEAASPHSQGTQPQSFEVADSQRGNLRRWLAWGGCAVAASGLVAMLSYPSWQPDVQDDLAQSTQFKTAASEESELTEAVSDESLSSVASVDFLKDDLSNALPLSTADATGGYGVQASTSSGVAPSTQLSVSQPSSGSEMGLGGYGGAGMGGGYGGEGGGYGGGGGYGAGMGGGYGGMGGYGGAGGMPAGPGSNSADAFSGGYGDGGYGGPRDGGLGGYGGGGLGASAGGMGIGGGAATTPAMPLPPGNSGSGARVERLYKNEGRVPANTVTPRIIIQEEEEEKYGGMRSVRVIERYGSLDLAGEQYGSIVENEFVSAKESPLSTFSIDVDTAAYSKCRQLLLENSSLPPADAVRLEEFVNYFDYEYAGPEGDDPFAASLAVATCPWAPKHKIVRVALQAEKQEVEKRPAANIVFLLDVSGSMSSENKLPLVKESMRMLIRQLGENDRVAMVVYAGAAGCVLESTTGDQQAEILAALDRLQAGGSTNGGQGIQLAYDIARDHFIKGGVNRVILCSDGDFNVGVTSTDALVDMVAENARSKVFLTVLGFGMGNTNDAMMEQISNKGNGVYGFVDNRREAHRQMVKQLTGNLITVAKDVKIQVEFNPTKVKSYRLLGYENRVMANEDFNDDTKDAGEIGAGHRVTAMYEIIPVGVESSLDRPRVDSLRYQVDAPRQVEEPAEEASVPPAEVASELLAVKLRYKEPEGDTSKLLMFPLADDSVEFAEADRDFRWATSMVQFGMLLRGSRYKGNATWQQLIDQASSAAGISPDADRQECLTMIRTAKSISGQ